MKAARAQQLFLPGFDPLPTDRLSFALLPDAPAARRAGEIVERLRAECGLKAAPLASHRLHVSLHGLGDYVGLPDALVARAQEAGAKVAEARFDVTFDCAESFVVKRRKRPLVLRGAALAPLIAFQQALAAAMVESGLGGWVTRRYTPHMTLLYDTRFVQPRPVEPVSWTVREFVLLHSLLGKTKYIPLVRWPLRDEEPK